MRRARTGGSVPAWERRGTGEAANSLTPAARRNLSLLRQQENAIGFGVDVDGRLGYRGGGKLRGVGGENRARAVVSIERGEGVEIGGGEKRRRADDAVPLRRGEGRAAAMRGDQPVEAAGRDERLVAEDEKHRIGPRLSRRAHAGRERGADAAPPAVVGDRLDPQPFERRGDSLGG